MKIHILFSTKITLPHFVLPIFMTHPLAQFSPPRLSFYGIQTRSVICALSIIFTVNYTFFHQNQGYLFF